MHLTKCLQFRTDHGFDTPKIGEINSMKIKGLNLRCVVLSEANALPVANLATLDRKSVV